MQTLRFNRQKPRMSATATNSFAQVRSLRLLMWSLPLLLSACGSFSIDGLRPVNALYCDNFLIYDMCARDTNRDGVVDFVYFSDTREVFMYRSDWEGEFPDQHGTHRCAMAMDEDLVVTTSRLFYIDEDTTYLEKQDIRGAMMIKYIAYMPEVSACNMRAEKEQSADS